MTTELVKSPPSRASFPSWRQLWLIYNATLVVIVLVLLPNWFMLLHPRFLASAIMAGTLANVCFLLGPLLQRIPLFASTLIRQFIFVAGMAFAILVTLVCLSITRDLFFTPSTQDILSVLALPIDTEDFQVDGAVGYSHTAHFGLPHNKVYIAKISLSSAMPSEVIDRARFKEVKRTLYGGWGGIEMSRLPHLRRDDAALLVPPEGSRLFTDHTRDLIVAFKEKQSELFVWYTEPD